MTDQLRDYQLTARDFLRGRKRAGLFLDMGLGKTAAALSALEPEHLPVLVVAPKRVAQNVWHTEAARWRPDLRVVRAVGSPAERKRALETLDAGNADIVVISRDNLRDVTARWRCTTKTATHPFRTFIIDELSGYKARGSVRWGTARRIIPGMPYVWGLTGTPSPNGLLDLWAQVFLLDGGQRLGKTLTSYRDRYFTAGHRLQTGIVTEWIPRPEAQKAIQRKLEDICLAMETEGRVALPSVTYNRVSVPLEPADRRRYYTLKKEMVLDIGLLGGPIAPATAAALSGKLAQLTAGFLYDDDKTPHWLHTNKISAVKEIVEATGSPVMVLYRFTAERDALLKAMPEARLMDDDAVEDWNAGRVPVLVAHPASIGHGLNLQFGGHTMVWMTLPWSLEEWLQTNKRLLRSGQQNRVVIHMLVTPNTVDPSVAQALERKEDVQAALLAHLESPL